MTTDNKDILQSELLGIRRMLLEDADLHECRERAILLKQSILTEQQKIADIDRRREWTQRFAVVNGLLQQHQQEAQNASREWASLGNDRANIALYDQVLPVRPLYDRIRALQDVLSCVREMYNKNEQETLRAKQARDTARNQYDVARQRFLDARDALDRRLADINSGYHTEGMVEALARQLHQNDNQLRQLQLLLNEKERALQELRQQEAQTLRYMEEANTQLKGLSAHSVMLGLYDLVKDKLSAMGKERELNTKLHQQQDAAQRENMMLQQSLRQRQGELSALESERAQYASQLLLLNQTSDTVLDIVRAPIIRDSEETQRQLDKFLDVRSQIRRLEEQIHLVDLQLENKRKQIEELTTEVAVANSHRLALEQSMRESDTEVGSLYADLDKIITLSGWFTEWQHSPDSLRSRISELYHEWQNARNRYNENSRTSALLRQSLAAAEQGVAEARQQEIQQRNQRDSIRRELESQEERLRATFGEQAPGELEKSLSADVSQASVATNETEKTLAESQQAYSLCKSRQQTLLEVQTELQELLRRAGAELDLWLENNSHSGQHILQRSLVEEIFNSANDWSAMRRRLSEAEIGQNVAAVRLECSQHELNVLQRSAAADQPGAEDAPALLLQRRLEAQRNLDSFESEYMETQGKLFTHERALKKIENLQRLVL